MHPGLSVSAGCQVSTCSKNLFLLLRSEHVLKVLEPLVEVLAKAVEGRVRRTYLVLGIFDVGRDFEFALIHRSAGFHETHFGPGLIGGFGPFSNILGVEGNAMKRASLKRARARF